MSGSLRMYADDGTLVLEVHTVTEAERREEAPTAEVVAVLTALRATGQAGDVPIPTLRKTAHYLGILEGQDFDRYPGIEGDRFRLVDDTGPTSIVLLGCRPRRLEVKRRTTRSTFESRAGRGPAIGQVDEIVHLDFDFDRAMSFRAWQLEQQQIRIDR